MLFLENGRQQAMEAMYLTLEAIGDRAKTLMTIEVEYFSSDDATNLFCFYGLCHGELVLMYGQFWRPQLFASLTIGGLSTGDLWANATLYSFLCDEDPWNCQFDQFFAQFTEIVHTEAVFSVFMYDEDIDALIGAYRQPDNIAYDNIDTSIIIMAYAGGCRRDRIYNATSRMRTPVHVETEIPNYDNCDWNPRHRKWWTKGQELGVGRAEWTEPYVFSESHRGMSYVAPSRWKGKVLLVSGKILALFSNQNAFVCAP